jgi:hypothetical protein
MIFQSCIDLLFSLYGWYVDLSFYLVLQESKILKFLGFMWNPLSWVMEAAALMAIGLAHGGVRLLFPLISRFFPQYVNT